MTEHTTLHVTCLPAEKMDWINSARVAGLPFAKWVRDTLNSATVDTAPPWMDGLSERARIALLGAGFDSRASIRQARADGFDFVALPNFGRRCEQELIEWLR